MRLSSGARAHALLKERRMTRDGKLLTSIVIAFAVRMILTRVHGIDSDEPQHLHVAWAWSRGFVQYRDVFDNHFPLLHLLFAPVMAVMPENSSVFLWMRLAMLPVAVGCGWLVFSIGRPLLGERGAMVAAIVSTVLPPWLPKSVEFRNDSLWIFFWLLTLALLVRRRRPFLAGLAAALCLLASVKALPLLVAHGLALLSARALVVKRDVFLFVAGAAVLFSAAVLLFLFHDSLDEMVYATLLYNASLPVDLTRRLAGAIAFTFLGPALALSARNPRLPGCDVFRHLTLFGAWYVVVLLCFWPSVSPRDFLPLVPLAALAVGSRPRLVAAPLIVTLAAVIVSLWYARIWRPVEPERHRLVDAVVALTSSQDYVFDLKGNAVFRRRPVYAIYDIVGRALTKSGRLVDDAPERIIKARCCVAIGDVTHLPTRTRTFLQRNFVDHGPLRVCGTTSVQGRFSIAVPEIYAVMTRQPSAVWIDGVPYDGPRFLAAGEHTIVSKEERVRIIWARAVQGR
jgi:hypothetical protein